MHAYVFFRVASLPALSSPAARRGLAVAIACLWLAYPVARSVSSRAGSIALPLDAVASTWVGVLFLLVVCLLAADAATAFGLAFRDRVPALRTLAVVAAGLLSAAALVQGLRAPEITERTAKVEGLEAVLEGLRIVAVSDLHVGPLRSARWLARRIEDVERLGPDLVAVVGDVLELEAKTAAAVVPLLRRLSARLGVFAVTGNHEYYAGIEGSVRRLAESGFRVLRDEAVLAAPGLVVAGVDDLTARRQMGERGGFLERALSSRPPGAVILLSHSPSAVERAAALGADVMISGHTHDGQIWPFGYLVRLAYPRLSGAFAIGRMTLVVSRGTGFWGPPMRLPRRAEIVAITLRRA